LAEAPHFTFDAGAVKAPETICLSAFPTCDVIAFRDSSLKPFRWSERICQCTRSVTRRTVVAKVADIVRITLFARSTIYATVATIHRTKNVRPDYVMCSRSSRRLSTLSGLARLE
jgi:hypothetical protein